MKAKQITMSENLYQTIVRELCYFEDKVESAEEASEAFYDILVEIQELYDKAEQED